MRFLRLFVLACYAALLAPLPGAASHLVTGNGFGFAVVQPENGTVSKFYAHPYSFVRTDPANPLSEGIETANFLKQISWDNGSAAPPASASVDYVEDSHVIRVHRSDGDGLVFMPFGLRYDAVILAWQPASSTAPDSGLSVEWSHPVVSRNTVLVAGVAMQLLKFDGIDESLLLISLDTDASASTDPNRPLAASRAWALISLENPAEAASAAADFNTWRAGLASQALAAREITQLDQWRAHPAVHFSGEQERHLWRQSEVMLRMAQSREPNRPGRYGNGLIVACLPDGVYFTPWVRDMAYAIEALIRMGHQQEARAGLLAYFNARPTGKMRAETHGADYQVSVVRYFGNGEEEPFFTQEGAINIEFDDWGLVLWVLGQYVRNYTDPALLNAPTWRGPLYQSARDFVVKPLLANLEPFGPGEIVAADTSIWEEHQKDKKHFAWSTTLAGVGLDNFSDLALFAHDNHARSQALRHAALLQKGFDAAFIRNGKLHGTLEDWPKNDIDGALLPIINLGLVTDPALIRNTVDRMDMLKVASGGYKRVRSNYTDPAIFEYWYEKEEFLFVDFSLAEVYRRQGRTAEADAILQRIVTKAAADHNIIPEMYVAVPCPLFPGAVGDPTGASPMVGYGAGEFILNVLERERLTHSH